MIDIEIFATTNRIRCAIEALGSIDVMPMFYCR